MQKLDSLSKRWFGRRAERKPDAPCPFFLCVSPDFTTEQMDYVKAKLAEFIAKP